MRNLLMRLWRSIVGDDPTPENGPLDVRDARRRGVVDDDGRWLQ